MILLKEKVGKQKEPAIPASFSPNKEIQKDKTQLRIYSNNTNTWSDSNNTPVQTLATRKKKGINLSTPPTHSTPK